MKVKLLIILLLLLKTGYASKNYNMLVNEAEQYIVIQEYNSALNKYFEASRIYNIFSIDIHNALVCAIYTKNENSIKYFGNLLSTKGIPKSYFLNKKIFNDLKQKSYWIEIAELSQRNYDKKFEEKITLIKIIDSVESVDSFYNTIRVAKDIANDTLWVKENYMTYDSIIKANASHLVTIFEQYGFPSDDYPYFYMPNDTTLSYEPIFRETIIHSYQSKSIEKGKLPKIDTFFTPTLRKALYENKISPYCYANLQDIGNLNMDFRAYYGTNHMFIKSNNEFYASPYYYGEKEIRAKINNYRVQIGLPTLEEEIKKIKFYDSIGQNLGFIFFRSYNTYSGFDVSNSYIKI